VLGSIVALRQERLKLLIAYSTLAQIGYLFLMFPLAFDPQTAQLGAAPWRGRAATIHTRPRRPPCSWLPD
jgi:NADH:ubiquinone oxidoreductase subunit 5 (subunit L)/multisubunit Na+/H+ antiporter MnhA subunit